MAIKASRWLDKFRVTWTRGATPVDVGFLQDTNWQMKVTEGGALVFKGTTGSFLAYPAHSWTRIDTPADLGPIASRTPPWCNDFKLIWTNPDAPVIENLASYQVKMLNGGVLLFGSDRMGVKEEPDEFILVAPHAWAQIHSGMDLTK